MQSLLWGLCICLILILPVQAQTEPSPSQSNPDQAATTLEKIQAVSVTAGVIISVSGFIITQLNQVRSRRAEAAKPLLELRQKFYLEAIKAAAVLSNHEAHSPDEIADAHKKFRQLYVAELSLVESKDVEGSMVEFARIIDPDILILNEKQSAAYKLAHALRDSLRKDWGVD